MTERSKRRAAEMAVIDTAMAYVCAGGRYSALIHAALAYEKLGLAAPTGTPTNLPPEQTALDAAASMQRLAGKVAGKVFVEILTAYHAGGRGLTTDAIELRLKGTHQGISPRVTELRDKGWIVDSGFTRQTRSGRRAIVWTPTQLGLQGAKHVQDWSW